jgi:hypothetical protein
MMKRIKIEGVSCFGGKCSNLGAAIRLWLSLLFALLLLGRSANAQDHVWSQLVGGSGNSTGLAAATDTADRAGETCAGGGPCWKPIGKAPNDPNGPGKGYSYSDKELAADGVQKIMYRGGSDGKSKVLLKAKGPNLPSGIAEQIENSSQATVQLHSSDGVCLSLTLSGNDRLFNRVN